MYNKELFDCLTVTGEPIAITSSAGGVEQFGPVQHNENARMGRMYISANGFGTVSTGLAVKLYASFNGASWYLQTAFPTLTTAYNQVVNLEYLPRYFKVGYKYDGQSLGVFRAIIEADSEY